MNELREKIADDLRKEFEFDPGEDDEGWVVPTNSPAASEASSVHAIDSSTVRVDLTTSRLSSMTNSRSSSCRNSGSEIESSNGSTKTATYIKEVSNNIFSLAQNTAKSRKKTSIEFLHSIPVRTGVVVMEFCKGDRKSKYSSAYFKFYLPQVTDNQEDFNLFFQKRKNKERYRLSLNLKNMDRWRNPKYVGKIKSSSGKDGKVFKLNTALTHDQAVVGIRTEERKTKLKLQLQFGKQSLFGSAEHEEVYTALVQKYVNPVIDICVEKERQTVLKLERAGDADNNRYFLYFSQPLSLLFSCAIACIVESDRFQD